MDEIEMSAGEVVAERKLRDVWVPTRVVFLAVSRWMSEAFGDPVDIDKGELAMRWCKWQRIKVLHDITTTVLLTEWFNRCYLELTSSGRDVRNIAPHISRISREELFAMDDDVASMRKKRTELAAAIPHSKDSVHGSASHSERHLWGAYTGVIGRNMSHFWPIADLDTVK